MEALDTFKRSVKDIIFFRCADYHSEAIQCVTGRLDAKDVLSAFHDIQRIVFRKRRRCANQHTVNLSVDEHLARIPEEGDIRIFFRCPCRVVIVFCTDSDQRVFSRCCENFTSTKCRVPVVKA